MPGTSENASVIAYLVISVNQGTYTIDAHEIYYYYQYGSPQRGDYDFGTTTMSVNPPDAHAFVTFQQGSLDMRLRLLNQTSMQIVESLQQIGASSTASQKTEQFTKYPTQIASQTSQQQQEASQQQREEVIMEAYDWTASNGNLAITLRNVGPAKAQFSDWFINGAKLATATGSCITGGTPAGTLDVGASCSATLTPASALLQQAYHTSLRSSQLTVQYSHTQQ